MFSKQRSLVIILIILWLFLASAPALSAGPVVRMVVFFEQGCAACEHIIGEFLPPLREKYGPQLEVMFLEISDMTNMELLIYAERMYNVPPERLTIPEIFMGEDAFLGVQAIMAGLEPAIERYLAEGGVDYPAFLQVKEPHPAALPGTPPTPSPSVASTSASSEAKLPIHVAYFFQTGCQECDRTQLALNYLQQRYPQLEIASFNVKEQAALCEWLGERAGVPVDRRLTAPAVFIGEDALIGTDAYVDRLEILVNKYLDTGAKAVWQGYDPEVAKQNILERFRSLGALTVVGAGLIDGLNPCAFATLVFFISYLTFSGRQGREVLFVGLAFALGVFLTYLVVGLGFWKVLSTFGFLTKLGRWLYVITALLCLVLAAYSLMDFYKARRGQVAEMTLKLPLALRKRINAVIRTGQQARAFVPVAFVTGVVISIIELACTGQVYLPTIIFVLSVPELRARAFAYLLLYNLCFIAPLIVVFLFAYYGTAARQFTRLLTAHTATIKLGTASLFLVLAGWLIYILV